MSFFVSFAVVELQYDKTCPKEVPGPMKKIIAVVISVLLVTALLAGCTLPDAINTITDAAGGGDFLRPEIVDDSKMDP